MFAKSIPGPKHTEKGWGCQDSSDKWEEDCTQVIGVADGHGGSDYFRSEYGSKAAIQTAFSQTRSYCKGACDEDDTSIWFSETGIANPKHTIWSEWRKLVKANWNDHTKNYQTIGEGELRYETVSEKYKARFTSKDASVVERYLHVAYGTTLLFAVIVKTQLLIMQIGDGTCVILQRNGEYHIPVPPEDENFLNVTVSLCDDEHLKIRHAIIDCDDDSPAAPVAVFLSSDGVDNCYPIYQNAQHLYKLYSIILENILKAGYEATESEIEDKLLPGMTAKGSQDDISLAFFISDNLAVLRNVYESIDAAYKPSEGTVTKQDSASDKTDAGGEANPVVSRD
jgi:hypothetical protein